MSITFSKILSKWMPLVLLSFIGLFLSECLIWNVSGFSRILSESYLNAASFLFIGFLMYFSVFVFFADIIQRFKIKDTTGLLLLGSIYGLFLEGLAGVIYKPGFGPKIFEIWLNRAAFTALSWHPIIDFLFAFIFLGLILKGKINLRERKIKLKEIVVVAVFTFFWTIWSFADWLLKQLPQGVPAEVQLVGLFYPLIMFGALFCLTFKYSRNYIPEKILTKKTYPLIAALLLYFISVIFIQLPNKLSFFSLYAIILFYILLLIFYLKFARKEKPANSIYDEAFPVVGSFSAVKYAKFSVLAIIFYFLTRYFIFITEAQRIMTLISAVFYFLFLAFSLIFPAYVIIRIVLGIIAKKINKIIEN